MATQEDRSLGSGMSFPKWMKTKMYDRFDLDQSTFSPTELDDSFMLYYRNNNRAGSEPPLPQQQQSSISVLVDQKQFSAPVDQKKPDFSKHTLYCQKFLKNPIGESASAQVVQYPLATAKTKSSGTDDGFKGEAAKCGSSVIRMAHQMVSGKVVRGFNMETNNDCDEPPQGFNPSLRRGSKSLPSSPLSSPKGTRKLNKFFTAPFVDTEHNQGGWNLSNLLSGKRKTLSQSVGYIAEEPTPSCLDSTSVSVDDMTDLKKQKVLVPKPSELREMNFWSPTSM